MKGRNEHKLLPCPFCESELTETNIHGTEKREVIWIWCSCGVTSGNHLSVAEAVEAWNGRAER